MGFFQSDQIQPRLLKLYEQLAIQFREDLPFAEVEHVPSTSINATISRDDLAVLVGVPKDKFQESLDVIISLGFSIKEDAPKTESLCVLESSIFNMNVVIQLADRPRNETI
jgi:GrpB-like predicted nucleotidyltransferase (UPF0157 family)